MIARLDHRMVRSVEREATVDAVRDSAAWADDSAAAAEAGAMARGAASAWNQRSWTWSLKLSATSGRSARRSFELVFATY